ncbi:hypothetical protein HN51_069308 [Arachis hypogaea]
MESSNLTEEDMDNALVKSKDSDNNNVAEELRIPLMHGQNSSEETGTSITEEAPTSYMSLDEDDGIEYELSALREATASGCTYLLGHGDVRAKKNSLFFKKLVINYFYAFLRNNCRGGTANMRVPHTNIIQVGMTYMV